MTSSSPSNANKSIDRHLRLATISSLILIAGFGGWAATTEISGAVLASGRVVVDANVKKVQHPIGGIVSAINVRNGQRVAHGEVLIALDATVAGTNLAVITKALDSLTIRRHRLEAERDGHDSFTLPGELTDRLEVSGLTELLATERGVFSSRRSARGGMRAQLQERIIQLNEQAKGLTMQAEAYGDSLELIRQELIGVEELYAKKLVAITRFMQLKRDEADMRGKFSQTNAEIAKVKVQTAEINLQILQIEEDLREEVTEALREVQDRSAELIERKIAALDQLNRVDIRSPADGVVHELSVHTVGGVVEASAALMLIVPQSDDLSIEVRIEGQDRDQIHVGQTATLRLTAFNQRTTPELFGEVTTIAADLVLDVNTGLHYYPVRIMLSPGEIHRLGGQRLTPGMPVESFVQTSYRTVLSYLTKPVTDYFARAFRSE